MLTGGEVVDAFKLPTPCSCAFNVVQPSYEVLLRIRRNCLTSAAEGNSISSICINNAASSGYAVGNYIQISFGTPSLLAYVTSVSTGKITGLLLINRPVFTGVPTSWYSATSLTGNGSGALFYFSVAATACCSCGSSSVTCTGANYINITNVQYAA